MFLIRAIWTDSVSHEKPSTFKVSSTTVSLNLKLSYEWILSSLLLIYNLENKRPCSVK